MLGRYSRKLVLLSLFSVFVLLSAGFSVGGWGSWSNGFNVTVQGGSTGAPPNFDSFFTLNTTAVCANANGADLLISNSSLPSLYNLSFYVVNQSWSSGNNATIFVRSNQTQITVFCNNPAGPDKSDAVGTFSIYTNVWVVTTNNTAAGGVVDLIGGNSASLNDGWAFPNTTDTSNMFRGINGTNESAFILTGANWINVAIPDFYITYWYKPWRARDSYQKRFIGESVGGLWFADWSGPGAGYNCNNGSFFSRNLTMVYYIGGPNFRCFESGPLNLGQTYLAGFALNNTRGQIWLDGVMVNGSELPSNVQAGNTKSIFGQSVATGQSGTVYQVIRTGVLSTSPNYAYIIGNQSNTTYYIVSRTDVDTSVPQYSFNGPANLTWTNGTVNFTVTVWDNVAVQNWTLVTNFTGTWGSNQSNVTVTNNNTINGIPINDIGINGYFKWSINVTDSSGNKNNSFTYNYTFYADSNAPQSFSTGPANNQNQSNTTFAFKVSSTDNMKANSTTIYSNFSGTWGPTQTNLTIYNNSNWIGTISVPSSGIYVWAVFTNDSAGNSNRTGNYSIRIDAVPPKSFSNGPQNFQIQGNTTFAFNIFGTDDLRVKNLSIWGNWSGTWKQQNANLTPYNNSRWIGTNTSIPVGLWVWAVKTCDSVGLCNMTGNYTLGIDNIVPKYSLGLPDNLKWTNGTVNFTSTVWNDLFLTNWSVWTNTTGTWALNTSNITKMNNNTLNGILITNIDTGYYKWSISACDRPANCNYSFSDNHTLFVDRVNPISQGSGPVSGQTQTNDTITFYCRMSDNMLVNTTQFWINTTPDWGYKATNITPYNNSFWTGTIAGVADGIYTRACWANDTVGNSVFGSNGTIMIDTNAPVITSIAPQNAQNQSNTTFAFECNATDNLNLSTLVIYSNFTGTWGQSATNNSPINNSVWRGTLTPAANAIYTWACFANDTAGNSVFSANRTFTVDTVAPKTYFGSFSLFNKTEWGQREGTIIAFSCYYSDNIRARYVDTYSNVTGAWGTLGGHFGPLASNNTIAGVSVSLPTATGWYGVGCASIDWAGNSNTSFIINGTLLYDPINATVTQGNSPADLSWLNSQNVQLDFKGSDDYLLNTTGIYGNWSGGWGLKFLNATPYNNTWQNKTLNVGADDCYAWAAFSNDTLDNYAYSANQTFCVDTIAPDVFLNGPSNNSFQKNTTVTFSVTPTDNINPFTCEIWSKPTGMAWILTDTNTTPYNNSIWTSVTFLAPEGPLIWNARCNDSAGNSAFNSTNFTVTIDTTGPTMAFNSSSPADLTSTNAFGGGYNTSWKISDSSGISLSTVKLYYKTNSSTIDSFVYINGTTNGTGWQTFTNFVNDSLYFNFSLSDNNVYPATYNLYERGVELTPHQGRTLGNANSLVKIELFNITNKTYSFVELMANNITATAPSLRVYYCNSSYTTGTVATSFNCALLNTVLRTQPYNHTHSAFSSHLIIPFPMLGGLINGVNVTNTSYLVLRGNIPPNDWNISYVPDITRTSQVQTSANGGTTYSNFAGTIDFHTHQFDPTQETWQIVEACDLAGNCANSTYHPDLLNLSGIAPSAPFVYSPTTGTYAGNIDINYTQAVSPNAYAISFYNITLTDLNETYIQTIVSNNSLNLSYVWDSTTAIDGEYFIKVNATDINGLSSAGFSENISILNVVDCLNITSPTTVTLTANLTANLTLTGSNACFKINSTDVTIDCKGYAVTGPSYGYGVFATNDSTSNLVITNCTFYNFQYAIYLNHTNGTTINYNNLSVNQYGGIYADTVSNSTFDSNNIDSNGAGWGDIHNLAASALFVSSDHINFTNNNVSHGSPNGFSAGLYFGSSRNITVINNTFYKNDLFIGTPLWIDASASGEISYNNFTPKSSISVKFSTATNFRFHNQIFTTALPASPTDLSITFSGFNSFYSTNFTGAVGMLAGPGTANNSIYNNTYNSSLIGLWLSGAGVKNNTARDNNFTSITPIKLDSVSNNTIGSNKIISTQNANPSFAGIEIVTSHSNYISNNNISNGANGVYAYSGSGHNNFTGNRFSNQTYSAIYLASSSDNNTFAENQIFNQTTATGIYLDGVSNNYFNDNSIVGGGLGGLGTGGIYFNFITPNNNNTFYQNNVSNVTGAGLLATNSPELNLTENNIFNSSAEGIILTSIISYLTGNNITFAGATGVLVSGGQTTALSNRADNNTGYGFHITNTLGSSVTYNTASSNAAGGFFTCSNSVFTFVFNYASSNTGADIFDCATFSGGSAVYLPLPSTPSEGNSEQNPNPVSVEYNPNPEKGFQFVKTFRYNIFPTVTFDPIINQSKTSVLYKKTLNIINLENDTLNLTYSYRCSEFQRTRGTCLNENQCSVRHNDTIEAKYAVPFDLICVIPKEMLGKQISTEIVFIQKDADPISSMKIVSVTLYPKPNTFFDYLFSPEVGGKVALFFKDFYDTVLIPTGAWIAEKGSAAWSYTRTTFSTIF